MVAVVVVFGAVVRLAGKAVADGGVGDEGGGSEAFFESGGVVYWLDGGAGLAGP